MREKKGFDLAIVCFDSVQQTCSTTPVSKGTLAKRAEEESRGPGPGDTWWQMARLRIFQLEIGRTLCTRLIYGSRERSEFEVVTSQNADRRKPIKVSGWRQAWRGLARCLRLCYCCPGRIQPAHEWKCRRCQSTATSRWVSTRTAIKVTVS